MLAATRSPCHPLPAGSTTSGSGRQQFSGSTAAGGAGDPSGDGDDGGASDRGEGGSKDRPGGPPGGGGGGGDGGPGGRGPPPPRGHYDDQPEEGGKKQGAKQQGASDNEPEPADTPATSAAPQQRTAANGGPAVVGSEPGAAHACPAVPASADAPRPPAEDAQQRSQGEPGAARDLPADAARTRSPSKGPAPQNGKHHTHGTEPGGLGGLQNGKQRNGQVPNLLTSLLNGGYPVPSGVMDVLNQLQVRVGAPGASGEAAQASTAGGPAPQRGPCSGGCQPGKEGAACGGEVCAKERQREPGEAPAQAAREGQAEDGTGGGSRAAHSAAASAALAPPPPPPPRAPQVSTGEAAASARSHSVSAPPTPAAGSVAEEGSPWGDLNSPMDPSDPSPTGSQWGGPPARGGWAGQQQQPYSRGPAGGGGGGGPGSAAGMRRVNSRNSYERPAPGGGKPYHGGPGGHRNGSAAGGGYQQGRPPSRGPHPASGSGYGSDGSQAAYFPDPAASTDLERFLLQVGRQPAPAWDPGGGRGRRGTSGTG
jgi:hypothetical protein